MYHHLVFGLVFGVLGVQNKYAGKTGSTSIFDAARHFHIESTTIARLLSMLVVEKHGNNERFVVLLTNTF